MPTKVKKVPAYYYKGELWGQSGYHIAFGETEFLFYFGTLEEAKLAALEAYYLTESQVTWKKFK